MKRILITGENSYIGSSLEQWLLKFPEQYEINKISLRLGEWRKKSFRGYDCVVHVAGIAHVDTKSKRAASDKKMEERYYKVNRDLTIECCKKAKEEGVAQFIFLSSIIVYGENNSFSQKRINKDTCPRPDGYYGMSKLMAEKGILPMESEDFHIAIIRPPMIYGKGSKGNYQKLARVSVLSPLFPAMVNERSMLYIGNLCEFLRLVIDRKKAGIYYPQNKEYVKTAELVHTIAWAHGRKIVLLSCFNPLLRLLAKRINLIYKVFGTMTYDKEMSIYKDMEYQVVDFIQSIKETER